MKRKFRNLAITGTLAVGILAWDSAGTVYAADVEDNVMSFEDAIQQPGYDPSINNTGIPYADQVVEEGEDGENNTENVEIEFVETSSAINTQGSGEWDYIGTYYFYFQSLVMTSHGGNAKFNIVQPDEDFYNYVLMEDDGSVGDDYITEWDSNEPDINGSNVYDVIVDAGSYVDGDNGDAEFYIKELNDYNEEVTCHFYD